METIIFERAQITRKPGDVLTITLCATRPFDGHVRPVAILECSTGAALELAVALVRATK